MIYTTAERLEHIASAMETISPEYAAQLKGYANYIRGLESTNIELSTLLREAQHKLKEQQIADRDLAELDEVEAKVPTENRLSVLAYLGLADCAIEESQGLPTYQTLDDLLESLQHIGQP